MSSDTGTATFLNHVGKNLLCAVDCETTGLDDRKHDILTVCFLPANWDLRPSQQINPFVIELKPRRPENIDPTALKINRIKLCDIAARGIDYYKGADYFVEWFEKLNLPDKARIMPIACNWPFDHGFIKDWLGPKTYDLCIHPYYRDVMASSIFINDNVSHHGNIQTYYKHNLKYLCEYYKIEYKNRHDALSDCVATLEVYRKMITYSR